MKTFISRLLLLAAGVLCLSCTSPVHGKDGDKEKIETLQKALTDATEDSKPITIKADYTEGLRLIQLAIKPAKPTMDQDEKLTFDYADKSFVLMNEGEGHIVLRKGRNPQIVVFDPKAKGVAGKQ